MRLISFLTKTLILSGCFFVHFSYAQDGAQDVQSDVQNDTPPVTEAPTENNTSPDIPVSAPVRESLGGGSAPVVAGPQDNQNDENSADVVTPNTETVGSEESEAPNIVPVEAIEQTEVSDESEEVGEAEITGDVVATELRSKVVERYKIEIEVLLDGLVVRLSELTLQEQFNVIRRLRASISHASVSVANSTTIDEFRKSVLVEVLDYIEKRLSDIAD